MIEITDRQRKEHGRPPTDAVIHRLALQTLLTDFEWKKYPQLAHRDQAAEGYAYRADLPAEMSLLLAMTPARGRRIVHDDNIISVPLPGDEKLFADVASNTHRLVVRLAGRYWTLGYFLRVTSAIRYGDVFARVFASHLQVGNTSNYPASQTDADYARETCWVRTLTEIRDRMIAEHGLQSFRRGAPLTAINSLAPEVQVTMREFIEQVRARRAEYQDLRVRREELNARMLLKKQQYLNLLGDIENAVLLPDAEHYRLAIDLARTIWRCEDISVDSPQQANQPTETTTTPQN